MALIVEFICELPNGVHARPASHVETLNSPTAMRRWRKLNLTNWNHCRFH